MGKVTLFSGGANGYNFYVSWVIQFTCYWIISCNLSPSPVSCNKVNQVNSITAYPDGAVSD